MQSSEDLSSGPIDTPILDISTHSESSTAGTDGWQTAPAYVQTGLKFCTSKFLEVTNLLLENPNLNSTHLFRADILLDSAGVLLTPLQKENALGSGHRSPAVSNGGKSGEQEDPAQKTASPNNPNLLTDDQQDVQRKVWDGFTLDRTVVRKLVPRKPKLDQALVQSCEIWSSRDRFDEHERTRQLVIYYPEPKSEKDIPWYHPPVRGLAYLYEKVPTDARLSVHILPFSQISTEVPPRLHRTLLSLLQTFVRLAKHSQSGSNGPAKTVALESLNQTTEERSLAHAALKDTILPQHIVQDTYSRLKQEYAADLINRWVEKTEPSKHVFEDLSLAAFLIELWKQMYPKAMFPGFVDIACGNGVLVYVLRKEGYEGCGFDARRRKTWDMLGIDKHLREQICVPTPFLDALKSENHTVLPNAEVHDGIFKKDTFIISNHADELTPWTPILAALSCPEAPLPFLAIPCCSHALSGARHRYSPKSSSQVAARAENIDPEPEQPATGDLKAMRAAKAKTVTHSDEKSMYACLTRKVVALAEEIGISVELTLMRIPSTRNIGIVGNRRGDRMLEQGIQAVRKDDRVSGTATIERLLERECEVSGGVKAAAQVWVERSQKLQCGKGRGKVNLSKSCHD